MPKPGCVLISNVDSLVLPLSMHGALETVVWSTTTMNSLLRKLACRLTSPPERYLQFFSISPLAAPPSNRNSPRPRYGTWEPEGGIMDASRWLPGQAVRSWTWDCPPVTRRPGSRDPNWDGTPVPKTPGKAKRRKLRRHQEAELLSALRQAQKRAVGWEMGEGWGGGWLTEDEWDLRLAEPRAAVERARAALAPMYYM
ncbi:hypothetical protein C8R47DRAFT_1215638 [Mycena vitilis]|nr:hypothetical protein C8R47DRAFT_1215638 [Mycena vitilis]